MGRPRPHTQLGKSMMETMLYNKCCFRMKCTTCCLRRFGEHRDVCDEMLYHKSTTKLEELYKFHHGEEALFAFLLSLEQ